MKPMRVVILGGTGFIGSRLVPRLHADGHRITLLSRNRDVHRELGVLPRVRLENADPYDRKTLERHLAGADAAINLVGILNEPGSDGSGFRRAHAELTTTLVAACTAARVPRLLQMSALRAGEGASHYLRTRGEAEAAVRASRLAWTIFRPSVVFGPGDGLFFRFAQLLRIAPVLPLARAGTRLAPVYVGDVAEAFARALAHRHTAGHVYPLVGPRAITLGDLVRWTAQLIGRRRLVIGLPDALGMLQGRVGEWLPGKPVSRDNVRTLMLDSTSETDGLGALGIVATPMEAIVPAMLSGTTAREVAYAGYRARRVAR
ncbi:complex I NDUFA9 subunit family protein [Dokdonella sp. MW10]|uniref:complex I NDUFA9 subunit family protein n=1 Tax=Dokdonella sp. MW10 TaxID=2992926 RepID=UPI003F7F2B95